MNMQAITRKDRDDCISRYMRQFVHSARSPQEPSAVSVRGPGWLTSAGLIALLFVEWGSETGVMRIVVLALDSGNRIAAGV